MIQVLDETLVDAVLEQVALIPIGHVATYGQIARLVGRPKNARLVGRILGNAPEAVHYPCHLVVTATGRLVPGWIDQGPMLIAEGVELKDATHVKLKQYQWRA